MHKRNTMPNKMNPTHPDIATCFRAQVHGPTATAPNQHKFFWIFAEERLNPAIFRILEAFSHIHFKTAHGSLCDSHLSCFHIALPLFCILSVEKRRQSVV